MNLNDAYPSKYLTAADLDGQDLVFTITGAKLETLGQGDEAETKLVLALKDETKNFVCNKTNASKIAETLGDETDLWLGKSITLGPREVAFGAKTVWSIRVITPPPRGRTAPRSAGPTTPDEYADEQASIRRPAQH